MKLEKEKTMKLKKGCFVKVTNELNVGSITVSKDTVGYVIKGGKKQTIMFNLYLIQEFGFREKITLTGDFSDLVVPATKQSEEFLLPFETKKLVLKKGTRGVSLTAELFYKNEHIANLEDNGCGGCIQVYRTMNRKSNEDEIQKAVELCKEAIRQQYIVDPELKEIAQQKYDELKENPDFKFDGDFSNLLINEGLMYECVVNYLAETYNQTESFVQYYTNNYLM